MLRRSPVTSGAGTETVERQRPPPLPQPEPRPSVNLPRKAWVAICVLGLFVAVTFSVLPVGARFGDDPLLRLRDLNPELSPPSPTAVCGAALRSLDVQPEDTSLFAVAKAHACERAAQRRVAGSIAAGAILVMIGLLGMRGGIPSILSGLRPT
ncbi:MAG: hypothetical protein ACRD2W_19435 [Acidimicrobiales bacterium]